MDTPVDKTHAAAGMASGRAQQSRQTQSGRTKTKRIVSRPLPNGSSFMVHRTSIVQDIVRRAFEAGIVMICAPRGFGKTALLIQYVDEVLSDPARGSARIIDVADARADELIAQLHVLDEEFSCAPRPGVAIDNLPPYEDEDAELVVRCIREMRDAGTEFVIACTPVAQGFIAKLGDSSKIQAEQLKVRPREYAEWARVLAISPAVDVYGLTQGIPVLVAALQGASADLSGGIASLAAYVVDIYRSVLEETRAAKAGRFKLAATMLLMGDGRLTDFERAGVTVDIMVVRQLVHDYPVFGYDASTQSFQCLGAGTESYVQIAQAIAAGDRALVHRAIRILLTRDTVDRAVSLLSTCCDVCDAYRAIAQHPLRFAVKGYATYVHETIERYREAEPRETTDWSVVLSAYAAASTTGDIKRMRTLRNELVLCEDEATDAIAQADWNLARDLAFVWHGARDVELPPYPHAKDGRDIPNDGLTALELHRQSALPLIERGEWDGCVERFCEKRQPTREGDAVDIPRLLLDCDVMLAEVLTGSLGHLDERDSSLARIEHTLRERRLEPMLCYVRLVRAIRRLFTDASVVDERACTDAASMAVRASDLSMQLFSTVLLGWQELVQGQPVNALFRAEQVEKLADKSQRGILEAALLLEWSARICNSSRVSIREEARSIDLMQGAVSPARAWAYALCLSAAQSDAELAAWYSLHKQAMLTPSFRLFARLAMSCLGTRADSLCRMLPRRMLPYYLMGDGGEHQVDILFQAGIADEDSDVGQVTFRLFGGFSVSRNGYALTSSLWRRKKAGILAARLALMPGTFVPRRTLTEEIWPNADYQHARESLYAALSVLRRAIGQAKDGLQYILVQGDGIAFNTDYVTSDVKRFNELAREVLVGHMRMSAPQIIETCLKIEELYTGPLYVPDRGAPIFFVRMRRLLQSKFTDCMMRGIETAIEEEDMSSALWMVEAALRCDAAREDVVRAAMRVYDLTGRRHEVVDVYSAHLTSLEHEARGYPEQETQQLYKEIIARYRRRGII